MSTDPLSRDSLAERAGGVWDYISPSRLSLWLKCPLAFRLGYVDGVKTPASPSLFIGKMCHAAHECHYRHRQLGVTLEPTEISRRLIESWSQAVEDEAVSFESTAPADSVSTARASSTAMNSFIIPGVRRERSSDPNLFRERAFPAPSN